MYTHLARITVHEASEQDYATLHDQMAKINFVRFIVDKDGRSHTLPDATYVCSSNETVEILRDKIRKIIKQTVPHSVAPLIIVVQYDHVAFDLPPDTSLRALLKRLIDSNN
ncbi:type V toxin-antitoxin system endoribonuclease antitoxin GhoS [Ralstonia solanacearum]|uniref:type V toxin-antitoxin system endoribonuclease antitoxin GhoS n=1 Tax=Ralstonia solanacearum TaxID=305 RepID=UPI0006DCA7EA|nr:type V toxin-antitoxin system endoribonuclease antitoxin GhoS [Ralstonia solanacearum]